MLQRTVQLTIGLAAMSLASAAALQPAATLRNLEPFSHEAVIPAGSDVSSIRLERVKLVQVPTQMRVVNGGAYCEQEQSFRDPGGSAFCPSISVETTAPAYELVYSYTGQPMSSDEYGGRNFTFSIYFRPEDFSADVRQELSKRKLTPALAELFNVTASGLPQQRTVIDERNSRFCDGSYNDGEWVQADRDCRDQIKVKTVTVTSDYLAVRASSQLPNIANR